MPDALVWGASGGIGGALVTVLKQHGWRVFAAARDETRIPPEADETFHFEAASRDTVESVAVMVAQDTDGLDLMVYAAGGIAAAPLQQLEPGRWQAVFDANLTGAYLTAKACLPLMAEGGRMVFLGAYVDKITLPKMGAYAAAKAGLEPMLKVLQKENRKHQFTLVRPGSVKTPFWEHVPFSLPKNAMSADRVAKAILEHHVSGGSGLLDL